MNNISESDKARVSESMKEIYESNADKVKKTHKYPG